MTHSRGAPTLRARWSLAGVALLALVLLLSAGAGLARADTLFNESFTGATTSNAGFSVGATAPATARFKQVCLTASTNAAQTPIPGCTAGQAAIPAGGDPPGSGALRFTNNEGNLAGFLLSNNPLPLTAGLDVSFDYYSYDKTSGTPADGLSFFLVNGTTTLSTPGAVGGSLGYAQNATTPGVANGYLGVGLDEYGNYTNNSSGKGAGCTTDAAFNGPALHANLVGVRGPGNGLTGYCLLAKSATIAPPLAVGTATSRTAAGVQQAVEIKVDPPSNPNPQITVLINGVQVLQTPEPPNPPPTFKFGFAASTGGANDIHEIQNVNINTVNVLPKLTLTSTPSGTPVPGGNLTYTLQGQTDPTAGTEAQPITITDTLPAGVTVSSLPSGSGWDCTATVVGSGTVSCTYTPAGPLAPGTALPPLSVPTHIAPDARGPLTSTAQISSTDNANPPPQSSAAATVTPVPAVDTSASVVAPSGTEIGKPATFTVTAANAGPSTATNATVTVPVPPGTTFDSGPAGCSLQGSSVVCAVGTLAPGATATLPLVFTPNVSGAIKVSATVSQTEPDSNTANNAGSATATVPAPPPPKLPSPPPAAPTTRTGDLGVTVTPPAIPPTSGQPTGFAITATNHGPDSDGGVVVSVPVPSGSAVVSLSPGCQVVSQTILCVAGTLGKGETRSFEVVVVPSAAGPLALTATVTGDLPDVNRDNNIATAQTTVTGAPPTTSVDLGVTVTAGPGTVAQGTPTTLTVTVTNHSSATATGVDVAIPLPPGATPVLTPKGCTRHGTVVICAIGTLRGHHTATFRLRVRPNGRGAQGTSATVRANQSDPKLANNRYKVKLTVTRPAVKPEPKPKPKPKSTVKPKPRLSLRDSFAQRSVIGGHEARLTLTVRTTNHTTARHVSVCDVLPPGMTVVSAPGARVQGRRVCFTVATVTGSPRSLRIEVRAATVPRTTVRRDHATAAASSARAATASGRLVVVPPPPPEFTG